MLAQNDIGRFDVAMQHAPAVRVIDGVADVKEAAKQLAQLQRMSAPVAFQILVGVVLVDGLLERIAANEPHGVVGPSAFVGPQPVDRNDTRVLQPAGDLSLQQEAGAAGGVVSVPVENLS